MNRQSEPELERIRRVRQLWTERYFETERTGSNVLAFHAWLQQKRPELLSGKTGDSY
jgi:hypothetical protein